MKAIKDGIDIVTEEWVNASIKAGKCLTDKKLFLSGGGGAAAAAAPADDDDDGDMSDEEPAKKKKAAPKKAAASKPASKAAAGGQVFAGQMFCVSGAFRLSQSEMKKLIILNGGDVAATPNKVRQQGQTLS